MKYVSGIQLKFIKVPSVVKKEREKSLCRRLVGVLGLLPDPTARASIIITWEAPGDRSVPLLCGHTCLHFARRRSSSTRSIAAISLFLALFVCPVCGVVYLSVFNLFVCLDAAVYQSIYLLRLLPVPIFFANHISHILVNLDTLPQCLGASGSCVIILVLHRSQH